MTGLELLEQILVSQQRIEAGQTEIMARLDNGAAALSRLELRVARIEHLSRDTNERALNLYTSVYEDLREFRKEIESLKSKTALRNGAQQ